MTSGRSRSALLSPSLPGRESRLWLYLLGRLFQIIIRTRSLGQIGKVLDHVLCVECLLGGGIALPRLEIFDVGAGHDISRDLQPALDLLTGLEFFDQCTNRQVTLQIGLLTRRYADEPLRDRLEGRCLEITTGPDPPVAAAFLDLADIGWVKRT